MLVMLQTHGEDVHAIRQEVLHLRQELESTFRKTLKDLGGTYRREVPHAAEKTVVLNIVRAAVLAQSLNASTFSSLGLGAW